jgi:rod shape-determining protein MreC
VLVLLVLTAVTLITLDQRGEDGPIATVRDGARDAMAPVQAAVDDAFEPIGDWWSGVTDASSLERENARLRRELADARGAARKAAPTERENRELKELAGLTFVPGLPRVTTQIVAASPGNFGSSVELDKGSEHGIAVGQPVVAGEGLVGRITTVSGERSTVLLLTDPESEVGARLPSGTAGVARGRAGSDLLALAFIGPDARLREGDLVVTAGLQNAAFPGGIPLGRVVSVKESTAGLDQKVTLRPLVDVGRLQFLDVLQWPDPGPPALRSAAAGSGG